MSQRTALFLSAVMTAFILVVVSVVGQGVTAIAALNEPATTVDTPTTVPANAQAESVPTPISQLSSGQAAQIALKVAPGAAVQGTPELVSFQGKVAYEVVLDQGKIYIDANSGEILSNGVTAQAGGPVNIDQAVQIAQDYMQQNGDSSELVGVRYGRARGMQLFEVTFEDRVQVYVNADTGEVAIVQSSRGRR